MKANENREVREMTIVLVCSGVAFMVLCIVGGILRFRSGVSSSGSSGDSSSNSDRVLSWGSGDGTMEAGCGNCGCLGCDETYGHGPRCS